MKNKVQRFGKFLSGMVMPNIGALIAFGFLAALFIDTGWIPNKGFNSMVGLQGNFEECPPPPPALEDEDGSQVIERHGMTKPCLEYPF